MTIKEAQQTVDKWITETGGGYFSPVSNIAALAEEVGELSHIVLRRYGEQIPKEGDRTDDDAIAGELADVLWVTLALANQMGIDLTDALNSSIDKKNRRDSQRFSNREKLTEP